MPSDYVKELMEAEDFHWLDTASPPKREKCSAHGSWPYCRFFDEDKVHGRCRSCDLRHRRLIYALLLEIQKTSTDEYYEEFLRSVPNKLPETVPELDEWLTIFRGCHREGSRYDLLRDVERYADIVRPIVYERSGELDNVLDQLNRSLDDLDDASKKWDKNTSKDSYDGPRGLALAIERGKALNFSRTWIGKLQNINLPRFAKKLRTKFKQLTNIPKTLLQSFKILFTFN